MTGIQWTLEQVNALAPDAASLSAGQKLNKPAQWQTLGQAEGVLWGECKGSGQKPYQVIIDMGEPAFKCSCPSRKFPCKHGLGLAFLYVSQNQALEQGDIPAWAGDWLNKRQQRKQKATETVVDEATLQKRTAAQEKRQQKRSDNIQTGVEDLQRWLQDQARQGLLQAADDQKTWQQMAERMVDAQAPGLASWLLRCSELRYRQGEWQESFLREIGRLYLALQAWQHLDDLPELVQADVRNLVGLSVNKSELDATQAVQDIWQIVGQEQGEENKIAFQRTWLYGQGTRQFALLLDFAAYGQVLPIYPKLGSLVAASLAFYPASTPLRAAIMNAEGLIPIQDPRLPALTPIGTSVSETLQTYSGLLAQSPWLGRYPVLLQVRIACDSEGHWYLQDNDGKALPFGEQRLTYHLLLALSGGHFMPMCAIWDGLALQPLSIWLNGECYALNTGVTL